jgi:arginase
MPCGVAEMKEYAPRLMERIDDALLAGKVPIVLGGDHAVSIPTISAVADALRSAPERGDVGIIWVDAHPDLETPSPDSTDDLHAMAAAHLLDRGVPALRSLRGFAPKVKPENLIYVGLSDVVPEERQAIHDLGITSYTMSDVESAGITSICENIFERMNATAGGFVVSFDVDAIDPSYAPGVDYAEPGGLTYREAMVFMEFVAQSEGLRLLEILEVNPLKDRDDMTSRLAARLIYRGIRGPVV